jgi:hypothetical protein
MRFSPLPELAPERDRDPENDDDDDDTASSFLPRFRRPLLPLATLLLPPLPALAPLATLLLRPAVASSMPATNLCRLLAPRAMIALSPEAKGAADAAPSGAVAAALLAPLFLRSKKMLRPLIRTQRPSSSLTRMGSRREFTKVREIKALAC